METIDMNELEQELKETRLMFQHWASSSIKAVQDCKSTHLSRLRIAKGDIAALEDKCAKAEKKIADMKECISHDDDQAAALRQRADLLAIEQRSLQIQAVELRKLLEDQIRDRDAQEADVKQQQAEQALRLQELYKIRQAYEKCLGLKLTPGNGELHFEFSQVKPSQPEEVYSFAVRLSQDDSYSVSSCTPAFDGWQEVADDILGQQRNLAKFVVTMRKKFQALHDES